MTEIHTFCMVTFVLSSTVIDNGISCLVLPVLFKGNSTLLASKICEVNFMLILLH